MFFCFLVPVWLLDCFSVAREFLFYHYELLSIVGCVRLPLQTQVDFVDLFGDMYLLTSYKTIRKRRLDELKAWLRMMSCVASLQKDALQ